MLLLFGNDYFEEGWRVSKSLGAEKQSEDKDCLHQDQAHDVAMLSILDNPGPEKT